MNFSSEDRKEVFQFFEKILRTYTEPVYCEYIRGHVSNAPPVVRRYVLTKLKGEHFLEYFQRRKNYFKVEKGHILLKSKLIKKRESEDKQSEQNSSKRLKNRDRWNSQRSESFSSTSTGCRGEDKDHSVGDGEREHEEFAMNFFCTQLRAIEKIKISSFEFELLHKKVRRHLSLYYNKKVKKYFQNFPGKFIIDDEENVSLHKKESKGCEAPDNPALVCADFTKCYSPAVVVDPEIQSAADYLEAIEFYVDVLKNQKQPFPIDKLGGYLSQASKNVKDFLRFGYSRFKLFFNDAPLIFLKNAEDELSLSEDCKALLRKAKKLIKMAGSKNSLETSLKSCINMILQPQLLPEPEDPTAIDATDRLPEDHAVELVNPEHAQEKGIGEENVPKLSSDVEVPESFDTGSRETLYSDDASECEFEDVCERANQERLIKFIFSVELYVLEMVEKEVKFTSNSTFKTVEYFISVLTEVPYRPWSVTSLKGTLGRAPSEVSFFINKLYKGDKLLSFFEEHSEFEVATPLVYLSPSYEKAFSNRQNLPSDFCSLPPLYESDHFKYALMEAYSFILEVLKFLTNKTKTKLSRLEKIMPLFATCFEWIKSSQGETISEKAKKFLKTFVIFEFLEEGDTTFLLENDIGSEDVLLMTWLEYVYGSYKLRDMKYMPFSQLWCGGSHKNTLSNDIINTLTGLVESSVGEVLKMSLANAKGVHYHEFAYFFPIQSLFDIIESGMDSRVLICAVLESETFQLKDGDVTLSICESTASDKTLPLGDISCNDKEDNLCDILNVDIKKEVQGKKDESPSLSIASCNAYLVNCSSATNDNFTEDKDTLEMLNVAIETDENSEEVKDSVDASFSVNKGANMPSAAINVKAENYISEKCIIPNACSENNFTNGDKLSVNHMDQHVVDQTEIVRDVENHFICEQNPESKLDFSSNSSMQDFSKLQEVELGQSNGYENTYSKADFEDSCISENENITVDKVCENHTAENTNLNSFLSPNVQNYEKIHCVRVNNSSDELFQNGESVQIAHENPNSNHLSSIELDSDCANDIVINPSKEDLSSHFQKDVLDHLCETSEGEQNKTTHNSLYDYENIKSTPLSDYENDKGPEKESLSNEIMGDCFEDHNIINDRIDPIKLEEAGVTNGSLHSKNKELLDGGQVEDKQTFVTVPENNIESCISLKNPKNHAGSDFKELLYEPGTEYFEQPKQFGNLHSFAACKDSVKTNSEQVAVSNCNELSGIDHKVGTINSDVTKVETLEDEIEHNMTEVEFLRNGDGKNIRTSQSTHHSKNGNSKTGTSSITTYPLQPLTAEIVLLTVSSCIATTEIGNYKQNIYFLKCVFSCDDRDCCSECFDDLHVGDSVSCFVPPAEMEGKMWVAFMVSKEVPSSPNGIASVNETLQKQMENSTRYWEFLQEGSAETTSAIESKDVSMQTDYASNEVGCQAVYSLKDSNCQTSLGGSVKLCAIVNEAQCQTNAKTTKDVSMQTEFKTTYKTCQTEISGFCTLFHRTNAVCQTSITGDVVNSVEGKEMLCQTDLSGNVKQYVDVKDVYMQTISTGAIMITKYHHM